MTDPFEEAVRAAGRELAGSEPAPTYHGAWKRGRRRRLAKRSAIALAGACALVVAFGTDIGRFQGGGTTIEVDDIALQTELVPAPTTPTFEPTTEPAPVPTTEPVVVDPDEPAPDLDLEDAVAAPAADADTPAAGEPAPTPVPATAVPTAPPAAADPEPTAAPTPTPTPTPALEPTPTPVASVALDPDPTPSVEASTFADPNDATDPDDSGDAAQSGPVDEAPGNVDTLPPADSPPASPESASRLGLPADARIAPDALPNGGEVKCDLDGDGVAEGLCELLPMYRCAGADEVRAGYQGLDLDGDGAIDTCVALVQTTCDTTGDGIGDVSCRIQAGADENPGDEGP